MTLSKQWQRDQEKTYIVVRWKLPLETSTDTGHMSQERPVQEYANMVLASSCET